jgi:hypothetical protein
LIKPPEPKMTLARFSPDAYFAKEGHQTTKGMGTGAWFLMGLENSTPRRRARGTRSIRIFFGCAGS